MCWQVPRTEQEDSFAFCLNANDKIAVLFFTIKLLKVCFCVSCKYMFTLMQFWQVNTYTIKHQSIYWTQINIILYI